MTHSLLSVLLVVVDKTSGRGIMTCYVCWPAELSKDGLGENLSELDTHLVYKHIRTYLYERRVRDEVDVNIPKELMPQMTPCVKILCS